MCFMTKDFISLEADIYIQHMKHTQVTYGTNYCTSVVEISRTAYRMPINFSKPNEAQEIQKQHGLRVVRDTTLTGVLL